METEKLKNIGINILKNAGMTQEDRYGNPIAILMVISILLTCVRIIQECSKNKQNNYTRQETVGDYKYRIIQLSKSRTWFTKLRLRRLIRKEMSSEEYKESSNQLLEAILNYGVDLTEEDTITLMEAAHV
jgi:hypothetical protein